MEIKITYQHGMVNIDSQDVEYANIQYPQNQAEGLQITEDQDHKRGEIMEKCGDIAEAIYALVETLHRGR